MNNEINAIILSGGTGSRMLYREKAFIEYNGSTLLKKKINDLKSLSREIIVVTNNPDIYPENSCRLVQDIEKDIGPLMGLYSGLLQSKTEYNFVTAVDMPFFNVRLYNYLKSITTGYKAVVPKAGNNIEPLFAFYSRDCIPFIKKALKEKKRRIVSFFDDIKLRYITENEIKKYDRQMSSFVNINTPEDLNAIRDASESINYIATRS